MKEKISRNKISSHYKSFFELENMALAEDDSLMIDWGESLINELVNQEVERRIKERMPSDELIEEIQEKSLIEYENAPICEIDYYSGFEDGCKWLRSRLTNLGVNDSQKTEGGGE